MIAELPDDGAHLSFTKLKLRWIVATRQFEGDTPGRLPRELDRAYFAFQPDGPNTPHPGLPREAVLQTLLTIAEQGYQASIACRGDNCSSSTGSAFQEQLRWLRPAAGQSLGNVTQPVVRTVNNARRPAPGR